MVDQETHSHWSHIRGEAMQGKLIGAKLTMLSSEMTTWTNWYRKHPETTVLDLPRTAKRFTREFYKDPSAFVYGWTSGRKRYHVSMASLVQDPVRNLVAGNEPFLLVFDPASTLTRLFSRHAGGRTLHFESAGAGRVRDRETGTLWDAYTGRAVSGALAGQHLAPRLGMLSYKRAWNAFYPNSITLPAR